MNSGWRRSATASARPPQSPRVPDIESGEELFAEATRCYEPGAPAAASGFPALPILLFTAVFFFFFLTRSKVPDEHIASKNAPIAPDGGIDNLTGGVVTALGEVYSPPVTSQGAKKKKSSMLYFPKSKA